VLDHVRRVAQTGFACHLRLHEEYDPSLPPVWGDRDQLIQILLNLVKNAAEAVDPREGEVALATAYHHGVRIADAALVEKRRGLGLYVTDGAREALLARERERFLKDEWPPLRERIQRLGFDVADLVGEALERTGGER